MINRRKFLISSSLVAGGLMAKSHKVFPEGITGKYTDPAGNMAISTWDFGLKANKTAMEVLSSGGSLLDAVEKGINLIEADPENTSVGIGGFPDRDGFVTLDACIMDSAGNAGSVTFLKDIVHPVSVARKVMEKTPHVMLSGDGALQFALENGFEKQELMTEKSRKAWEEWKIKSQYKPVINIENHDTIGLIVMDAEGNVSGGCSTSGLAYKIHGRVGDSPIIGAGLYVDNEVGAAVATGLGEMVMKTLGSFLVVELMRGGKSPQESCEEAILRIVKANDNYKDFQVALIAINKSGEIGSYAIHPGFSYAFSMGDLHRLVSSSSYIK